MKKYLKVLFLIAVFIFIICVLENFSMAYDWKSEITSAVDNSKGYDNTGASISVRNVAGSIITIMRVITVGIAIIMLIVLAIKYMIAAPGDKADIKKHAMVYIIGAIVAFAAAGILTILERFALGI